MVLSKNAVGLGLCWTAQLQLQFKQKLSNPGAGWPCKHLKPMWLNCHVSSQRHEEHFFLQKQQIQMHPNSPLGPCNPEQVWTFQSVRRVSPIHFSFRNWAPIRRGKSSRAEANSSCLWVMGCRETVTASRAQKLPAVWEITCNKLLSKTTIR